MKLTLALIAALLITSCQGEEIGARPPPATTPPGIKFYGDRNGGPAYAIGSPWACWPDGANGFCCDKAENLIREALKARQ